MPKDRGDRGLHVPPPKGNFSRQNHKPSTRTRVLSSGHRTQGPSATPSRTSAVADIIYIFQHFKILEIDMLRILEFEPPDRHLAGRGCEAFSESVKNII